MIDSTQFQIILLIIGVGTTGFIAYLFKVVFEPKIEKMYKTHLLYVHQNIFGMMDRFDVHFEIYYKEFERNFGNIKDLSIKKWAHNNPETEGTIKNNQIPLELKLLHTGFMKKIEEYMTKDRKEILDFLKINQMYFDPKLSSFIVSYLRHTIYYIYDLKYTFNIIQSLQARLTLAKLIIFELTMIKKLHTISNVQNFEEKWEKYIKSENMH